MYCWSAPSRITIRPRSTGTIGTPSEGSFTRSLAPGTPGAETSPPGGANRALSHDRATRAYALGPTGIPTLAHGGIRRTGLGCIPGRRHDDEAAREDPRTLPD